MTSRFRTGRSCNIRALVAKIRADGVDPTAYINQKCRTGGATPLLLAVEHGKFDVRFSALLQQ